LSLRRHDAKTAEDFAAVPDALRTLLEGAKGARPSSALALPASLPPKLRGHPVIPWERVVRIGAKVVVHD
jgi:hypothetical protein